MNTGVYAIEHVASGRKYVGSAVNFAARWRVHLCDLRKGVHHSSRLQNAWNKYGEEAFVFKKLLVCAKNNLLMYEQRCLDGYRAVERSFGYNTVPKAGSQTGMKHGDEARAKIKAKRATQVFSAETRALWSKNRTGRKMPEGFGARAAIWRTKVDCAVAAEIRLRYECGGISQRRLAALYGVTQPTIGNVVRGKHGLARDTKRR